METDLFVVASQILLIYAVVIACIYSLSTSQSGSKLWVSLFSSCLGYLLRSPSLKLKTYVSPAPQYRKFGLLCRQHADDVYHKTAKKNY